MKRLLAAAAAFCILFCLCSCAEPVGETSTATSAPTESQAENDSVDGQDLSSGESEAVLSYERIEETWDSGVAVDADVTTINQDVLSTYTGTLRTFNIDELTEVLGLSQEDAVSSYTDQSTGTYLLGDYIYLLFEDNRGLICNAAWFSYESDTFLTVRDLLTVHGSEANADVFLTGKNLDFATIEQAQAEIQAVLDNLEIPVVREPRCYTLDYDSLSAENERQYAITMEMAEGMEAFIPEKLEISEEDACYVFYYPVAIDGMPVSPYSNGVYGDGSLMGGTELIACYNRDGLAGLYLEYQPLMQEKSEAQPVISLEEILEKEKAKYDSVILEGEYTIYDIRLEYIAQPVSAEENSYNLIPVWRFSVEHEYELNKGDEQGSSIRITQNIYDLFNAFTGEEIPYNAGDI